MSDKTTFYVCVEDTVLGTETWYTVRAFSAPAAELSVSSRAGVLNEAVLSHRISLHTHTEKPEWM